MLSQQFKCRYNSDNPDLNLIMEVMCHPQKEEARLLLRMIDDIINTYTNRADEDLRLPLVYIPVCEPWAQEICIEFIALKISLLYNNIIQDKLKMSVGERNGVILSSENYTRKKGKQTEADYKYSKRIYKLIKDKCIPESDQRKNVLICKPFEYSTPSNPYINNYCGNEKTLSNGQYALTRADVHVKYLDQPIKNDKNHSCTIDNFFVFLSKSVDGRLSEEGFSYQRPRIERLNKLRAGTRNVFFFYFSMKPYKLQRLLIWKQKNAVDLLHKDVKDMRDFISLTSKESDFIFGRNQRQTDFIIETNGLDDFKSLVDDALDACEYNVQVRNESAICCDDNSRKLFKCDFEESIEDIDAQYFNIFLDKIKDTWNAEIWPKLIAFLGGQTQVSIILDYFIPDANKQLLDLLFREKGIQITIHDFKSLKYKFVEGVYLPNNLSNKIIVLSYQGHYVGKPYNRYPNSFDPFCVGENQELLNIINCFVLDPYYAIHKYDYYTTLRYVLTSEYRNNYVKCTIPIPPQPKRKIDDAKDRTTYFVGSSSNQYNQKFKATIGGGESIILSPSDYIIFKEKNNDFSLNQIVPVPEFDSIMQNNGQNYLIFPLSRLQEKLESIIDESEVKIKEDELYFRKNCGHLLTVDEIESESELWEILLCRKVDLKGSQVVYDEIMSKISFPERISIHSFERWCMPNNDIILPRSRKMQDVIFEYLAISKPYDKLIRRKKAQKGTLTELKNSMLRTFLCNSLFSDDIKHSFERLSDGIKEMLGIDTQGDFEALIDLLTKEIKYDEIKSMSKYDKN